MVNLIVEFIDYSYDNFREELSFIRRSGMRTGCTLRESAFCVAKLEISSECRLKNQTDG